MDIRNAFEAWLKSEFPDDIWSTTRYLECDGSDQYQEDFVEGAWRAWQAATAAQAGRIAELEKSKERPGIQAIDDHAAILRCENRITELEAQVERMREALNEAADDIASWASYASDYFYQKHDAAGCIAKYRALAAQQEQEK